MKAVCKFSCYPLPTQNWCHNLQAFYQFIISE